MEINVFHKHPVHDKHNWRCIIYICPSETNQSSTQRTEAWRHGDRHFRQGGGCRATAGSSINDSTCFTIKWTMKWEKKNMNETVFCIQRPVGHFRFFVFQKQQTDLILKVNKHLSGQMSGPSQHSWSIEDGAGVTEPHRYTQIWETDAAFTPVNDQFDLEIGFRSRSESSLQLAGH